MTPRRTPSDLAALAAIELVEQLPGAPIVDVLVQLGPSAKLGAVDVLVAVELVRLLGGPPVLAPLVPDSAVRGLLQMAPAAPAAVELVGELGDALAGKLAVELAAVDVLAAVKLARQHGPTLAAKLAAAGAVQLAAVDVLVSVELVSSPAVELRAVDTLVSALRARVRAPEDALTWWRNARGGIRLVSAWRGRPARASSAGSGPSSRGGGLRAPRAA